MPLGLLLSARLLLRRGLDEVLAVQADVGEARHGGLR
jgi:hypothetical protein